ncbi:MAG: glycoside hydrolase family 15 protein [Verrucomicrobia bacterium]|nr:MAG: glycoside hydrolase family 15 protein [Verrucomicrobiota bacterium]
MRAEVSKIQDYAIIGNARSAALISNRGSLDWLCWPRFDSASIFGAIVDPMIGGRWSICPESDSQTSRRYIDDTNVLETTFSIDSAKVVLTDFMPVTSEEEKKRRLWPEHEVIRQVTCENGEMHVVVHFDPRPDYGRAIPSIKDTGKLGWRINVGTNLLNLRSDIELVRNNGAGLSGKLTLKRGDIVAFSLTFSEEGPAVLPPLGNFVREKLKLTIDWWRRWAERAKYDGPYRKQVIRSALVLALLSFAPSGALVAAPTTSLPERIGRDLNWDYRYCWLRDEALAVRALFGLGYDDDAEAFVSWLLHATRLTRPRLDTLYNVYGEITAPEKILSHLSGYAGSRPVRLGNAASDQLQLDVYGEVIEAVSRFLLGLSEIDRDTQNMLRGYGEYVCRNWCEPDNGMWEPRTPRQHYTHSRLLCWVALDRLIDLHKRGRIKSLPVEKLTLIRERIRSDIETRGWNEKLQAYTQVLGGESLDANTLLLAIYAFEDATSYRMQQTHERLRERLCPRVGLMYRDERSKEKGEGVFGICSFWEANFLARSGNLEEAHRVFAAVLECANDVDLFAEEIHPETGDALGNFPQAFTHLGLISAALALRDSEERRSKLTR